MMFIGNIIAFSGNTIPEGYLECDGSAVSRDEYPDLFSVIGTSYGAGDGSTTFNLPNLSGRVALGASQSYSVGANGGEEAHSLAALELPSHIHLIPEHTHGNSIDAKTPSLSHTITQPVLTYTRINNSANSQVYSAGSTTFYSGRSNKTMSRATNLAIANHPATPCTVTGGILDCPTFNTESTGGGVAHNNMMPYLAVKYLIRYENPVPIEPGMLMYNGFMVATAGGGYISGKTV
jgi:microcystin-dependent protein